MSTALFPTPSGVFDHNQTQDALTEVTSPLESLVPPATVKPVDALREQIIDTWLPKFNEPDLNFNAVEWYQDMEKRGLVTCKEYSPGELRSLEHMDRLLWKERAHFEDVLNSIQLPLDPNRSFGDAGESPVIFIRDDKRNARVVMNGNQRTGKIMYKEHNPEEYSLYVIEFSSLALFNKLANHDLDWGYVYLGIDVVPGGRRTYP
jgi:hypothetical protein